MSQAHERGRANRARPAQYDPTPNLLNDVNCQTCCKSNRQVLTILANSVTVTPAANLDVPTALLFYYLAENAEESLAVLVVFDFE
jgi:hypothetical protein